MAVVVWRRVVEGVELTGKVGDSLRVVEKWIIRVDSPATAKLAIIGAIPIGYGSSHWEFTDCKAQEFSLSPTDKTGMFWILSVTFYIPPPAKKVNEETGVPDDYWECSGGTSTIPVFQDTSGNTITNSAKDPIEGLEREREEESWVLTKYYEDDTWMDDRDAYAGRVNSDSWAGGGAKEWKCYFKGARKKEIQDVALAKASSSAVEGTAGDDAPLEKRTIVETTWEFRKEPETWKCMPWDVGFHELVSGERKVITGSDGKPVKQPVALNSNGTKKAANTAPSVINSGSGVDIYPSAAFATVFGTPSIVPAAPA
jgi:hypothetical protein